jgi:hypothetical protein
MGAALLTTTQSASSSPSQLSSSGRVRRSLDGNDYSDASATGFRSERRRSGSNSFYTAIRRDDSPSPHISSSSVAAGLPAMGLVSAKRAVSLGMHHH